MVRRATQLFGGLILYGVGCALMVEAGIGLDPWTVFAQGLSLQTGVGIGWLTNLIGLGILLLWIPLRQRPGWGTLANIAIVGTAMQVALDVVPAVDPPAMRVFLFMVGLLMVAVASGLYLGTHLGPGPRDGLMTGLSSRYGLPIWGARAGVELTVLGSGWLMGGDVGVGTVVFAAVIGPLVHVALPIFDTRRRTASRDVAARASSDPVSAPDTRGAPFRA